MDKIIIMTAGYWSTNIGNSFFNLGTQYILKQAFPEHRIVMLSDFAGYLGAKNYTDLQFLAHINPDFFVLHGPFLTYTYSKMIYDTILRLKDRGTKIIFISSGMLHYSNDEIDACRSFVKRCKPFLFLSRDEDTYEIYSDLANYSYNGIDTAFFVSYAFKPITTSLPEYAIFNFDLLPPPKIFKIDHRITNRKFRKSFEFQCSDYLLEFPQVRSKLTKLFSPYRHIDRILFSGAYPKKMGELKIIWTNHCFQPYLLPTVYKIPDSFTSDIPYTYLNLYAGTKITLSNRVHACVATLSYGKPALLFSKTRRAKLFERLRLSKIVEEPVHLPKESLIEEKTNMVNFIKGCFQS